MKKLSTVLSLMALAMIMVPSRTALAADPAGSIVYSLPSTTLTFSVEAVRESFYAGPYAKFASKYLGIDVRQEDAVTYQLTQVNMTPYVEADHSTRYVLDMPSKAVEANFLKMASMGLISFADGNFGDESVWRFPTLAKGDFSDKGVTSNLASEETTLYKNVKGGESVYSQVAVQQSMIVEKSLEKRAAETAELIFGLRKKRVQIITGDTDATYSGEAMGAAIDEITRLEKEYMSMFIGYSEFQTQKMKFDVVPTKERDSQKYIAFRISDSQGLVSADNISGKPVLLEITTGEIKDVPAEVEKKASKNAPIAYFRTPAICSVRLVNGADVILQSRVPIYQLGVLSSLPVSVSVK